MLVAVYCDYHYEKDPYADTSASGAFSFQALFENLR